MAGPHQPTRKYLLNKSTHFWGKMNIKIIVFRNDLFKILKVQMCLNPQVLTGTSLLIFLYNVNFYLEWTNVVAEFLLTKIIASSLCIAFSLEQVF